MVYIERGREGMVKIEDRRGGGGWCTCRYVEGEGIILEL